MADYRAALWPEIAPPLTAWKGFDWEALGRLHRMGMISDPVSKAKSVVLKDGGLGRPEKLLVALFAKAPVGTAK